MLVYKYTIYIDISNILPIWYRKSVGIKCLKIPKFQIFAKPSMVGTNLNLILKLLTTKAD